jgi:hypothetical protein
MLKDLETELKGERRNSAERRFRMERRTAAPATNPSSGERRDTTPRRKVERRRQIDPTTCERDYSLEEIEFMRAMDDYKRRSGRPFPTWSEVLEVVRSLGYGKVGPAVHLEVTTS